MRKRLTYANVAATMALVFSMSGGAIAANHYLVSSTKQISPKVLKKLKGATGKPGATGSTGLRGLQGKEGPAGKEATNALSLGGVPASGYTRSDCTSLTGQIKGFALVPGESTFPSTLTTVSKAYNCSGLAVQARRIGQGDYEIKFLGSPVTIATGNINDPEGTTDDAFVSFSEIGPGDFEVLEYNAVLKSREDRPFSVIAP